MRVIALMLLVIPAFTELTVQVDPKREECFFDELNIGDSFVMDFEVIRGGLLDIKLRIYDPNDSVVHEKLTFFNRRDSASKKNEGHFSLKAKKNGPYKFCFDNRMSRWTAKVVTFHVVGMKEDDNVADKHGELAKLEHLGPVVDSVIKIADELDLVQEVQHRMRVEEQSSRDLTYATNSRVHWLSLTESAVLIIMSIFQFKYVQTWFKTGTNRKMSGRV